MRDFVKMAEEIIQKTYEEQPHSQITRELIAVSEMQNSLCLNVRKYIETHGAIKIEYYIELMDWITEKFQLLIEHSKQQDARLVGDAE